MNNPLTVTVYVALTTLPVKIAILMGFDLRSFAMAKQDGANQGPEVQQYGCTFDCPTPESLVEAVRGLAPSLPLSSDPQGYVLQLVVTRPEDVSKSEIDHGIFSPGAVTYDGESPSDALRRGANELLEGIAFASAPARDALVMCGFWPDYQWGDDEA